MTEPRKTIPTKRTAARRTSNGRSQRTATETAQVAERGDSPIPGSSLVVHRFPHGALAGKPWIGAGGITYDDVRPFANEIAAQLAVWTEDLKLKGGGPGGTSMLDRNAYIPPDNIFDQMRMSQRAIENDDVVGAVADGTEALAMRGIRWESTNLDDADVFNQWAQRVNLDFFIRAAWRELLGSSQFVAARWWGFQTFKVRGQGPPQMEKVDQPMTGVTPEPTFRPVRDEETGALKKGQKRKKVYEGVYCPTALTVLDGTKVLPLGSLMFGQERLVWTASASEMKVWETMESGQPGARAADPIMANFFLRRYQPSADERDMIRKLDTGVNPDWLLEMNPMYVWRHTLTRPHYKPWADIRMKRVFRFLDMKQQLMNADRVALVGNANYILLVKKGEKDNPATQEELDDLNANFNYVAKLPVIIGDHTLSIEIITPKADFTLDRDKYAVVNESIRDSLLSTFTFDTGEERGAAPLTGRMIVRALDNRRHGLKRDFEEQFGRAITDHPFNEGKFDQDPNLAFTPRNMNLDTDQALLQTLIAVAARGDLSRKTLLEEIGYDEESEARYREMEALHYDPIFKSATPFNSPGNNPFQPGGGPGNNGGNQLPPGAGGGGRPPGGGGSPADAPGTPKPRKRATTRGKNRSQGGGA